MLREKVFVSFLVAACGLLLFVPIPPLASEYFGQTDDLATKIAGILAALAAIAIASIWLWSPHGIHQLRARAFALMGAALIIVGISSLFLISESRATASSITLLGVILMSAAETQRRRRKS